MAQPKRVILTNETPNDQGGIIYNNTIDWGRFSKNPVMLYHHGDDKELADLPLGHWEDLQFDGINWTAIPVFSKVNNPKIQQIKQLYEEGNLKAASMGGAVYWKTTGQYTTAADGRRVPVYALNAMGLKESEKFISYEASVVPMPSNPDALKMSAKCYETEAEILTLNSKFMTPDEEKLESEKTELAAKKTKEVEPEKVKTPEEIAADEAAKLEADKKDAEKKAAQKVEHIVLSTDEKTNFISEIITAIKGLFASENPTKHMESEPDGDEPVKQIDLPTGDGETAMTDELSAKTEKKADPKVEPDEPNLEAKALEKVKECSNETELAAVCETFGSELPQVVKDAIEQKKLCFPTKSKNNSNFIEMPEQKTKAELDADAVKLAATPKAEIRLGEANVPTFTKLQSEASGRGVIEKVLMTGGMLKNKVISDVVDSHRIVLQSIINDPKYQAIVDKINFSDKSGNRSIPGSNCQQLMQRLSSQSIDIMNFTSGKLENMLQLGASDDLLTSPDLNAVEWLSMFVFALFPSTTWKAEIPVYGATSVAGSNKGFIFPNIAANPTIVQGSRPSNPSDEEYTDTPVSITLSGFYMEPIVWQPLLMQTLRYDQMGTGWSQAMMVMNTFIDNYLIYTLLTQVPTASVVTTDGATFNIASSASPDSFLLNTGFTGNLGKPRLENLLVVDQLFKKQNFPDGTKFVVIQDPTMDRYITADKDTQSLLTRFVNSQGDELISYKHAMLRNRSKVGLWNKATSAVVNPSSVLAPTTTVGACLCLVPDQAALALAALNVFMIQDPTVYGYRMSANVRMGAGLIRSNGAGSAILTYGDPQN